MKIATWNVNSLRVRLDHVREWIETEQPDVLALQETKTKDDDFPTAAFGELGYHSACSGQPTYNGVAIISKLPATDVVTELDGMEDPQRRVLGATFGGVRVYDLYVPNGQSVESEKYQYKLRWLECLRATLATALRSQTRCIVLGDFNIAPEDRDVHDPDEWAGKVLCSEPERRALQALIDLGFVDVYRNFEQPEQSFSWWDYRAAAFRRNRGLRIDLILASQELSGRCTGCTIDTEPRRLERPSDHTPVVATFAE